MNETAYYIDCLIHFKGEFTLQEHNDWLKEILDPVLIEDYDGLVCGGHNPTYHVLTIPVDTIRLEFRDSVMYGAIASHAGVYSGFGRLFPDTTDHPKFALVRKMISHNNDTFTYEHVITFSTK